MYINSRLRYNYFQFRKTNVGHIGIPLPHSTSTLSPLSAFDDALEYQIIFTLDHGRRKYDVISIFKMAVAAAQYYFYIC